MIRLLGAELTVVTGPLLAPVHSALATWRQREGLLLTLHGEAGRAGVGEASPLPSFSRESLADCRQALTGVDWSAWTLDTGAAPLEEVARIAQAVAGDLPAARFAVETALLDLWGRTTGQSVPALLGVAASARVSLSVLLVSETAAAQTQEVRRALRAGCGAVKRKLRGPNFLDADLALLQALREEFGPHLLLRLDANGAFEPAPARAMLEAVAAYGPELVEEPVAGGDLLCLAPAPVPLAADETLLRPEAWEPLARFFREGGDGAVVLKPMALGGFAACLALAKKARGVGARVLVTHLFDGPVGMTASAALALTLAGPEPLLPCGLAPHPALGIWPEVALPFLVSGQLLPWRAPGLGLPEGFPR